MRRALTAAVAITVFGALLAGPTAVASADRADTAGDPLLEAAPAPVTGTTDAGGDFEGEFVLERFKTDGETLFAVGQLTGTLTDPTRANGRAREVSRRVSLPVTGATAEASDDGTTDATAAGTAASDEIVAMTASMESVQAEPVQQEACDILNLDLGPLDLNLLGLRVQLDEINLDITAVPGAGNLLGNLLCAVAGLLDPLPGGGGGLGGLLSSLLQGIVDLLNQLLGGLGG